MEHYGEEWVTLTHSTLITEERTYFPVNIDCSLASLDQLHQALDHYGFSEELPEESLS
jgi:hypothetical protein